MKIFGKIILKVLALASFPIFLLLLLFYALIIVIIDFIAFCKDFSNLNSKELNKRQTDRENNCLHSYADFALDYFKFIFLDWK